MDGWTDTRRHQVCKKLIFIQKESQTSAFQRDEYGSWKWFHILLNPLLTSVYFLTNITLWEIISTVNFTYNEQAYNEILLVTKSNESPCRSSINLHWVLYVCNELVYNELSALTKPSRGPMVIVSSIYLPVVTKCCTDIPN